MEIRMIKANFRVVATILALHVPKEIATQFKQLNKLSTANNDQFEDLVGLTESNVLAIMHSAYEEITAEGTPLHIPPIFVGCMGTFLAHEKLGHLSDFITSVHANPEKVKQELGMLGITVTYEDDGVQIETGNMKIMPEPDMMQ
jgi:hypothetical protein